MFHRALLAAAVALATSSAAFAGVAGHSFGGTLVNRAGASGDLCMSFDDGSDNWVLQRQFESDASPVATNGTFAETDFILFSFFNGHLGNRAVSGFQVLGFVIVNVSGPGGSIAAQGTAFFEDCGAGVPMSERSDVAPEDARVPAGIALEERRRS